MPKASRPRERLPPANRMTSNSFYEEGSRLLTPGAFEFVLESELKRAVRSQDYLTLIVFEAKREWEGMTVTADDGTVREMASLVSREVRETDLIGHTDKGTLALVLLDSDFDHSTCVIDRLAARIETYEFPTAVRVAVGAASYPTHAIDADSLKRQARARPVVNCRGGFRSPSAS